MMLMLRIRLPLSLLLVVASTAAAFVVVKPNGAATCRRLSPLCQESVDSGKREQQDVTPSRRAFLAASGFVGMALISSSPESAEAIGPIKIDLENPKYTAKPCPKDRPIPGEKAMQGMQGLCVTVDVDMKTQTPKDLEKVGVYGYITYDDSGESVLANNPDLSTDAGQFAMIESVSPNDTKLRFEFIAAIPRTKDVSQYENGIGTLQFESLRIISFPGGQQYGAINPCEMNEFSDECEAWEAENGRYEKGEYMMKSNPRTKGQ